MCFPILTIRAERVINSIALISVLDKVIGVAQLCNKLQGGVFSSFDEDIAQAFSVYCCISIVHVRLFKTIDLRIISYLWGRGGGCCIHWNDG